MPIWLRWILCIPATLLAYLIVNGVNRVTLLMVLGDPNSLFFKTGTIVIEGTIAVMASLYVLYKITPNHKNSAIIAASIIIGAISIIGMTLQTINQNAITPLWQILLSGILSIGSCLFFCKSVIKDKILLNINKED